jgi:hypothetical protein
LAFPSDPVSVSGVNYFFSKQYSEKHTLCHLSLIYVHHDDYLANIFTNFRTADSLNKRCESVAGDTRKLKPQVMARRDRSSGSGNVQRNPVPTRIPKPGKSRK